LLGFGQLPSPFQLAKHIPILIVLLFKSPACVESVNLFVKSVNFVPFLLHLLLDMAEFNICSSHLLQTLYKPFDPKTTCKNQAQNCRADTFGITFKLREAKSRWKECNT